jgi:uncharacterized membrane protein YvbJ
MNCGTKLNEEDAFCHNCGSPTDVSQGEMIIFPIMTKHKKNLRGHYFM